jgi:predicted unusual protein kinase regulating ubiquinone biosynthesis (AarF/ABC1/UbiB family)
MKPEVKDSKAPGVDSYGTEKNSDHAFHLPNGCVKRAFYSGRTAAGVGGKALMHYAKRPFMSAAAHHRARDEMIRDGAKTLFQGLSLLKGTALKLAQLLSLELDLLPEAACRELARAYHQVPPINRALVRKAVRDGLNKPPEEAFQQFDLNAFAAASIGQVHAAADHADTALAVKIQYPGIAETIESDLGLLRQALRPVIQTDQLLPLLRELSERLHEEVDYHREADHLFRFARSLKIKGVRIPEVKPALCSRTVLSATRLPGVPLNHWLESHPDQAAVDHVAQMLQRIFITGFYDLHVIHADPNPGNFIIADDLTVGLVDFGCMKTFSPAFAAQYRRLVRAAAHQQKQNHFREMIAMGMLGKAPDKKIIKAVQNFADAFGHWLGRLFEKEKFDFGRHPDFIAEGKSLMVQGHQLWRHMTINPDFIFLNRTRYGLLRLFERMGARVCFRNVYEWK